MQESIPQTLTPLQDIMEPTALHIIASDAGLSVSLLNAARRKYPESFPQPVAHTEGKVPLYDPQAVLAWWQGYVASV